MTFPGQSLLLALQTLQQSFDLTCSAMAGCSDDSSSNRETIEMPDAVIGFWGADGGLHIVLGNRYVPVYQTSFHRLTVPLCKHMANPFFSSDPFANG